ncbi:MAG TPA: FemAB family XrtA/PEP-CTERM system-associated protein [Gemmatimonadaceae bacterium]|nr:FemAB family XrtA/PEP-CTERM system-associated protein [Gemmatimonadaceae bacterium]
MRVELFSGDAHTWDAFAAQQDGFTHFHRYGWRGVIESVFGHECSYLVARDGDTLCGVLPLVRVKSVVFGHYLVSMPFLNYGGPLGSDAAVGALVDHVSVRATKDRAKLLELRSRRELPIDLRASHRKITVVLDLAPTADATFKQFDAKLRSQVRRPQKEGVTVQFGRDQVDPFFHVFARHMRDLGTPTQSRRFFTAIADAFPEDALFACAYLRGQPVAAGCGFTFGTEFEMTWASSLREFNRESPNMLLYWACIERAVERGLKTFNFGRCTPGSGTHRFKMQWGGREEPLWWYGLSSTPDAATPSPNDGAYSWGPRLWRHLPTPLATALGPRIVRYIP